MAYPAMMTLLPPGIFGIVVASLFAAYMSTIATHLNLGSSYMVNDFYKRFVNPTADEKKLVRIGRIWTVLLMVLACVLEIFLQSAFQVFEIILLIGAGTGLIFLLRWFWWRINAYAEIAAMCVSFPVAIYFKLFHAKFFTQILGSKEAFESSFWNLSGGMQLVLGVILTTIGWVTVMYLTPPDDKETLRAFVKRVRAGGPGWKKVYDDAKKDGVELIGADDKWPVPLGILCSVLGCVAIYAALFAVGAFLYGQCASGVWLTIVAVVSSLVLWGAWIKMKAVTPALNEN
ncbi:MAG: Na+:solute symporter, partial [Thermoguttaceae bacterium]|nr:Na+:solute symporter [Thermoguttaceae bacterium]